MTTEQLSIAFDYAALNVDVRLTLRQRAERINERTRNIARDIWENGREFYEAQQELAQHRHGCFIEWAEKETGYSKFTVYRFIRVYQQFNCSKLLQLNVAASALYLLAAPSTPEEVRTEALARAEAGERITHSLARSIVKEHQNGANTRHIEEPIGWCAPPPMPTIEEVRAERTTYICPDCNDGFDAPVWHCPHCDHHYHDQDDYCHNCHNVRPQHAQTATLYSPVEDEPLTPYEEQVAALQERYTPAPIEEQRPATTTPEPAPTPPASTPKMAVHFSSASPEWYTPAHIVERVLLVFGEIDLDPCSNSADPESANVPARVHYDREVDGLVQSWRVPNEGEDSEAVRVYMNPPYGDEISAWTTRLLRAYDDGEITEAIALLPARTDTGWMQPLLRRPDVKLCFVTGRLRFVGGESTAPFPSVVAYLGRDHTLFGDAFEDIGPIR